jgi:hypothetical protein
MVLWHRVALFLAIPGALSSYFVSRYFKSRNKAWIAGAVIIAGVFISLVGFVILDDRIDDYDRRSRRMKGKLERAGYSDYNYKCLNRSNPKSIRLLELVQWTEEDLSNEIYVRIRMRATSIEGPDAIPYEALSYCWGDATTLRPIVCNDAVILVTASLYQALERLHIPGEPRILWVDALCINQADLAEKNWQVRMMSEIYKNATRVLAYLGEDMEQSEYLDKFILRLSEAKDDMIKKEDNDSSYLAPEVISDYRKAVGTGLTDIFNFSLITSMQLLLLRDWFNRVWIIQEITLAKDAILLCGNWEIPWTRLLEAFEALENNLLAGKNIVDIGINRLERLCWSRDNVSSATLAELLFRHRGSGASNSRDHVYALVGLATDVQDFEIDYTKSVSQVYIDTAGQILSSSHRLTLLNFVCNATRAGDLTLPSWVPDWRSELHLFPLWGYGLASKHIGRNFDYDEARLTLYGIEVDRVALLGICAPYIMRGSAYKQWRDLQYFATLGDWIETFISMFSSSYPVGEELVYDAFWEIIAARQQILRLTKFRLRSLVRFFRVLNWFRNILLSFHSPKQQILSYVLVFLPPYLVFGLFWIILTKNEEPSLLPFEFSNIVIGRRMIGTEKGFLGLALENTQAGDKIFLVDGAITPIILRRSSLDDGTYELVGECYLHGYMDKLAADVGECHQIVLV